MTNTLSQDIIQEWGLEGLPPEKQQDMVERIGKLVYQAILVRSLDILSEQEQTEFDLLLDEDSTTTQDVMVFLHSKIPTFEMLLGEEREKLKVDLMVPSAK